MPSPPTWSAPFAPARLAGILLLAAPLLAGADDNYLREIEEEAKRQATTLTTSQPQPAPALTAPATATGRLAPGLDRAAFERALREGQPGLHASYQRLDSTGQQQVYETYRNDSRLASIGERIARLLGTQP